ncbi:four helix bundle protein [Planctomicrobium sp. SH661]|uniref:four helix bundle protein n=1 Tax=Planctomicrobium sp. SH661 TaxID=3448124 RepID=UPI003F5B1571
MYLKDYRDLNVWQKSMDLAVEAYSLTQSFPETERFGLISQAQRAAASIPANIAEGHAQGLPKPFLRHLRIANGSLAEVETHFRLAERLKYVETALVESLLDRTVEVRRMLHGLKQAIEKRSRRTNE